MVGRRSTPGPRSAEQMSYLYSSNRSSQDRYTQLEIQLDDGSSAVLEMSRYYDLSATEVARATPYIVLTQTAAPADATPIGIARLSVKGNPGEGEVPVWSGTIGAFVPGAAGAGTVGASAYLRPTGGDDSAQVVSALANYAPYVSPSIVLGPGIFLWNTAVPAFARSLAASVVGSGVDKTTVRLSSAAPRTFDFNKIADYDTFQDIEIGNFTVDDNNVGLKNHIVIGTYPTPATSQFRLNFKRIRIHHIRTINVPSAGTTGDYAAATHHPLNINIAVQDTVIGGTRLTAEDITVEDCRFEGGNEGVFIGGGGVNSDGLNIWLDRIHIRRCWHSVMTLSPNYAPQNHFQVGSRGIGGYGEISDCYGWGSGDDGIETNGLNTIVVERCVMEDVRGWGFLHTNYNTPENVDSQICTWRDTTVRRTQQASDPGSGFVGWYGSGRRIGAVDIPAGNHKLVNGKYYATTNFPRNACVVGILTGGAAGAGVTNGFKSFEIDGLTANISGYTNATASLTAQQVIRMTNGVSASPAIVKISGVSIKVNATQGSTGGCGHTCLWLEGVLKVDVDGLTPDLTVAGGNQASVLVGCDCQTGTLSGRIRGMRVAGISGDPNPRGIIVRGTSIMTVAPRLDIEHCDFSAVIAGGEILFVDATNRAKVYLGSGIIYNVYPKTSAAVSTSNFASATFTSGVGNQYIGGHAAEIHFANGTGAAITAIDVSKDGTTYENAYTQASGNMANSVLVPVDNGDFVKITFATTAPTVRVRPRR